jgi:nucleotide-binding universal stress UspA family protein
MSGNVSHKLSNAFEGALAGGGDPATSPLYVFGPFLKLIVVAGVAEITFGASVWLVVLTIAVVSAMYRLVMRWVTDGSGGSGLSEEEFGGWAVKVNAAITFIEYTLTFLVSMAALVTFLADRFPVLNSSFVGVPYRNVLAILLSILTGWLVNRGPKVATRAFGPATAGVLALLWIMILTTVWRYGFHLPKLDLQAFQPANLNFTIGGYVRILAVMTGIEVFANLVAAYEGDEVQKGKKAFASLLIIMGTASITMLIVGPIIFQLSDPTNPHVSVFTQTMDKLLPEPLPYIGTLIGVAVLMSASAASAQGLQNLALGLRERHYIPYAIGRQNEFDVADKPVWIEVAVVGICFLLLGTHEETYLAVYAAGVFILLSMTGWAVTRRLVREMRKKVSPGSAGLIFGTSLAALLTSSATVVIFAERFLEGAWTYFLLIPLLYAAFTYYRNRLGEPSAVMDYLGLLDTTHAAGFGFGQFAVAGAEDSNDTSTDFTWKPEPITGSTWRGEQAALRKVIVLMDGSPLSERALPSAASLCRITGAKMVLLTSLQTDTQAQCEQFVQADRSWREYFELSVKGLRQSGVEAEYAIRPGNLPEATAEQIQTGGGDLVVLSTGSHSRAKRWDHIGLSRKLVQKISTPILILRVNADNKLTATGINRIVVALDGSIVSERSLPYARLLAKTFGAELILTSVPAVPQVSKYRAPADFVRSLEAKANRNMGRFLKRVADSLLNEGVSVRTVVTGSLPARAILSVAKTQKADMIMLTSRGRGRLEPLMGSVARQVVENTDLPIFIMPVPPDHPAGKESPSALELAEQAITG